MRIKTHPGEVLREEFLIPLNISANRLALDLRMPANRITKIIREERGVTPDTALRLAKYFGTTPEFWINLQSNHDLSRAKMELREQIEAEVHMNADVVVM